jgi:hypothetical protein
MMDLFMGLLDSADDADGDNFCGDKEPFANELERCLSHAGMKLNQSSRDVCMWFKDNSPLFSIIGFMARDFLGSHLPSCLVNVPFLNQVQPSTRDVPA